MKKIILIICLFPLFSYAQLASVQTIGQPTRNQATGNGLQVGDTLLQLGPVVIMQNVIGAGDSNDSVFVKDNVTQQLKLVSQSSLTGGSITGNPTEVLYFNNGGSVTSDARFFRTDSVTQLYNFRPGTESDFAGINIQSQNAGFFITDIIIEASDSTNGYYTNTEWAPWSNMLRMYVSDIAVTTQSGIQIADSGVSIFDVNNPLYFFPITSDSGKFLMSNGIGKYTTWENTTGGSYTDEEAQDAVGTILTDGSEIDFTYNDGVPSISATLINGSIANARLTNSTISGIPLGSNLADLTAASSRLTFSGTYNGSAARTVDLNLGSANTWSADQSVPDEIYGVGWNGSFETPTKNAVYDKIESVLSGGFANTALSNLAAVAINADLDPGTDNVREIGNATNQWNALYLGDLGFILWAGSMGSIQVNGSDMLFANSTSYAYDAVIRPATNDGAAIGSATRSWSDLFFASGAVTNYNNGNYTVTHSAGVLTYSGDVKITGAGNASTSALTTSATQTITGLKTFNDNIFEWNNPAATFQYRVRTSAIGADLDLTLPAFNQAERFAVEPYNAQLTGDQTSVSTSLADVPGMTISTAASTEYDFTAELQVTTNATTVGILCTVNHSTAITSINLIASTPITATTWFNERITALDGGTLQTAGPGATVQTYRISGTVVTNTAGTLALRFRSETGAAAVVKAGSWIKIERTN